MTLSSDRRSTRRRQHSSGWAYAGSQRHVQAYVNTSVLTELLNDALRNEFPSLVDAEIEWRSPLASTGYVEYQDRSFWSAVDCGALAPLAAAWWPTRGGPVWDALAVGKRTDGSKVVVLVEAKANAPEFQAGGCGAAHPRSIAMIHAALSAARERLRATGTSEVWHGTYYQLANRLAWTLWLRQQGVDAVFAHVLFASDFSHVPTDGEELLKALRAGYDTLGVDHTAVREWAATIVLPAIG
jgi:hypothetical protein